MLPLIDMANHSFDPNCEVLPTKGGGVVLVAKKQVRRSAPLARQLAAALLPLAAVGGCRRART
jgi:hypothetical protein